MVTDLPRRLSQLSLFTAPALLLASEILRALTLAAPRSPLNFVSQVLALAALVFFIPALLRLAGLLRSWSPAAEVWTVALALVGIVGTTAAVATRVLLWGFQRTLAPEVFDSVRRAVPLPVLLTLLGPSIFFSIGLITLAAGLWRSRTVSRPSAAVFLVGAILFPIGTIPDITAVIMTACVALLFALGLISMSAGAAQE